MKPMEASRSEFMDWVASTAADIVCAHGLSPEQAAQAGAALADEFAQTWGGRTLYFPTDAAYKITPRDREVLQAYRDGTPVRKLASTYKMSEQGIRKLLRRASIRDQTLQTISQIDLFDRS